MAKRKTGRLSTEPTPAEIRRRCRQIQATWDAATEQARRGVSCRDQELGTWLPPTCDWPVEQCGHEYVPWTEEV